MDLLTRKRVRELVGADRRLPSPLPPLPTLPPPAGGPQRRCWNARPAAVVSAHETSTEAPREAAGKLRARVRCGRSRASDERRARVRAGVQVAAERHLRTARGARRVRVGAFSRTRLRRPEPARLALLHATSAKRTEFWRQQDQLPQRICSRHLPAPVPRRQLTLITHWPIRCAATSGGGSRSQQSAPVRRAAAPRARARGARGHR